MTHPHAASSSHGGGHPGAAVDPNGLAMMLRTGTQDLHDQAESGDFQQRMVDGKLVRDEFVAFLQQIWHVHAAMEPLLRSAAGSEPRLGAMLEADHYRLEKIEGDLRDLGAERSDERLDSTKRFIASIEALASDNPLALVGV
ncbi:MAG: biliverdin-producing heme oxygenase, partial [Planctomycetota bacterium]